MDVSRAGLGGHVDVPRRECGGVVSMNSRTCGIAALSGGFGDAEVNDHPPGGLLTAESPGSLAGSPGRVNLLVRSG